MAQGKLIVAFITLVVGFMAGFVLRPVIAPPTVVTAPAPLVSAAEAPRSVQYFVAHVDEARRVDAGCRSGSVRGGECANANQAVVHVDSRERTDRFLGKHPR